MSEAIKPNSDRKICHDCGEYELDCHCSGLRSALNKARERIKILDQLNLDSCHDDTAIRNLVRPILGDFATDGDSYGVPGVVDLVESLIAKLAQRDEGLKKLLDVSNQSLREYGSGRTLWACFVKEVCEAALAPGKKNAALVKQESSNPST